MKKILLLSIFAALFLYSCASNKSNEDTSTAKEKFLYVDSDHLNVATFNIEWLGDGVDDKVSRTDIDIERIADIIIDSELDIIGLQEIENPKALDRLIAFLPGYAYKLANDGYVQNVGVLYKNTIEVKEIGMYMPVRVRENRTRPGFVFEAKKGNFDFIGMVVHFKSTSRYDNTEQKRLDSYQMRKEQSQAVAFWADSILKSSDERDLFVLGDFNDNPNRENQKNLMSITSYPMLSFLTADLVNCKNPQRWDVIDHIVVSESAKRRFIPGSERVYNFFAAHREEIAEGISDHCPVIATFEITSPDND